MRLVTEATAEDPELSLNAAVIRIGPRVRVVPETLLVWMKQPRYYHSCLKMLQNDSADAWS
jgi:hypothetical protein